MATNKDVADGSSDESIPAPSSGGTILVTGGCGYIGTHTIVCLLQSPEKYDVVVVDNLSNSSPVALDRVAEIMEFTREERAGRLKFHEADLTNEREMRRVFHRSPRFSACIHFAGLKAVGESMKIPIRYYENNLSGTFVLLRLLDEFDCRNLVFSSSATVYGAVDVMPITESSPVGAGITNPYGQTKYMLERVLTDLYKSSELGDGGGGGDGAPEEKPWSIAILRYFNPVGAHPSGLIGEDPNGPPNNLMPYVSQVAVGRREFLTVFGDDYDTKDGTGVRDYLHVMDLANGHLSAISYMKRKNEEGKKREKSTAGEDAAKVGGLYTFNLGTGNGYSVLEMVKAMEKASGKEVKYKVGPRRSGDIATCYADASLAKEEMGWEAKLDLDDMCRDLWCWQQKNPNGFGKDTRISVVDRIFKGTRISLVGW